MVKKCSNCYWGQERGEEPNHFGCYADSKWKKWVPKKEVDIPRECKGWKGKESHPLDRTLRKDGYYDCV